MSECKRCRGRKTFARFYCTECGKIILLDEVNCPACHGTGIEPEKEERE